MVADRVVVTTRSAEVGATAVSWDSTGDGSYTLADADMTNRGTEIKIYVRSDCDEFLDVHRLENIVRRHSDYVSYPIKVGGKQANNTSALWTRPRNEITAEQYDAFDYDPPYQKGKESKWYGWKNRPHRKTQKLMNKIQPESKLYFQQYTQTTSGHLTPH